VLLFVSTAAPLAVIYSLSLTTLFRSLREHRGLGCGRARDGLRPHPPILELRRAAGRRALPVAAAAQRAVPLESAAGRAPRADDRSEEHTSELQSRENLVCRLLLEKKK